MATPGTPTENSFLRCNSFGVLTCGCGDPSTPGSCDPAGCGGNNPPACYEMTIAGIAEDTPACSPAICAGFADAHNGTFTLRQFLGFCIWESDVPTYPRWQHEAHNCVYDPENFGDIPRFSMYLDLGPTAWLEFNSHTEIFPWARYSATSPAWPPADCTNDDIVFTLFSGPACLTLPATITVSPVACP